MDTDTLKGPIQVLSESPVFAMSLSSKELFHSNMLAWICVNVEGAWAELFGPEMKKPLPIGKPTVDREKANLDLTLEFAEGRVVVIENKVKSLPDNEQLDRYRDLAGRRRRDGGLTDLIILTMGSVETAPSADWNLVDYGAMSLRLAVVADRCDGYHRALIRDYSAVVGALNALTRVEPMSWLELPNGVDALRIKDLFEKRKADRLRRLLSDELGSRNIAVRHDKGIGYREDIDCAYIHYGLTRTQGLVGTVYSIGDVDLGQATGRVGVVAGVQLQGSQLRSYVEFQMPEKPDPEQVETLRSSAEALFDSTPAVRWWSGGGNEFPRRAGKSTVNQFDGRFFYRYINVASLGEAEKTFDALASRMAGMLEDAIANRRDIVDRLAVVLI